MTPAKKPPAASLPALALPASGLPAPALSMPAPTPPRLPVPAPGAPLEATVNMAPAAAAKLTGETPEKTAAAMPAGSALPGWQSLGRDHKPTHANGKQGRREKKVRW